MKQKNIRANIRLSEIDMSRIKKISKRTGENRSQIFRRLLEVESEGHDHVIENWKKNIFSKIKELLK